MKPQTKLTLKTLAVAGGLVAAFKAGAALTQTRHPADADNCILDKGFRLAENIADAIENGNLTIDLEGVEVTSRRTTERYSPEFTRGVIAACETATGTEAQLFGVFDDLRMQERGVDIIFEDPGYDY